MSGKICPYFVHGVCKFGEKCRNLHDFSAPSDDVCRYYLAGACSYGSRCRYKHVRPDKKNNPKPAPKLATLVPKVNLNKVETVTSDDNLSSNFSDLNLFDERPSTNVNDSSEDEEKHKSFADVLRGRNNNNDEMNISLCPFFEKNGICPLEKDCNYVHGEMCDICNMFCLHPRNKDQRRKHIQQCTAQVEENMNQAFAYQISEDKVCSICLEHVVNKKGIEARFGILENCNHVFCLDCIRKWRASESFENKVVKACPECRITSDFVTPSTFWYENDEHKARIIQAYKKNLHDIDCKYFDFGRGQCPFGNKCFYRHCYLDGTRAILGDPTARKLLNASGELSTVSNPTLYSFLEARDSVAQRLAAAQDDSSNLLDYLREAELVSLDSTIL